MIIEAWSHSGVLPDGTLENGSGRVCVDAGAWAIRGRKHCKLCVSRGLDDEGFVNGVTLNFDSLPELETYVAEHAPFTELLNRYHGEE